jgi:hypothetical protein
LTCEHHARAQSGAAGLLAPANPAIQAQIKITFDAFFSHGHSEAEVMTNWQGFRELTKLKKLTGDDEQLVTQLAVYAVAVPRVEEQQILEALHLLRVLHIKPIVSIRVLAPYLGSDSKLLRGFVSDWFEHLAMHGVNGTHLETPNFRDFRDYIVGLVLAKEEVPAAFVEFFYTASPHQALTAFHRANRAPQVVAHLQAISEAFEARQRGEEATVRRPEPVDDPPKSILLAAHIIDNASWLKQNKFDEEFQAALPDAKERLAKLSARNEWWVRLYVAEIMRRRHGLRIPEVLEKLRADHNALVSKAATSFTP